MLKQPRSPLALGSPVGSFMLELPAQTLLMPTQHRLLGSRWALHPHAKHLTTQVPSLAVPEAALTQERLNTALLEVGWTHRHILEGCICHSDLVVRLPLKHMI